MRVHPGGIRQAEVRSVHVVGSPVPEIRRESLDGLRRLAESTYTNDPLCRDLTGCWTVLDPENARFVHGVLQNDVLTVWSDVSNAA